MISICYGFIVYRVTKRKEIHADKFSSVQGQHRKIAKESKRVTVICALLVVSFAVCWLPFHLFHLVKIGGIPLHDVRCHLMVNWKLRCWLIFVENNRASFVTILQLLYQCWPMSIPQSTLLSITFLARILEHVSGRYLSMIYTGLVCVIQFLSFRQIRPRRRSSGQVGYSPVNSSAITTFVSTRHRSARI